MSNLTRRDIKERPLQLAVSLLLAAIPLVGVTYMFAMGDRVSGVLFVCIFLLACEILKRDWKLHAPWRMALLEPDVPGILAEVDENLSRFDLSPDQANYLYLHAESVATKMAERMDALQDTYRAAIETLAKTNVDLGQQLEKARACLNELLADHPGGPVVWVPDEPYGETLRLGILRVTGSAMVGAYRQAAEEAKKTAVWFSNPAAGILSDTFTAWASGEVVAPSLVQDPEA